ncbi:GTP cyclohydrolase I FolE [Rickettsia typhi]|uniref:GTP cyclohydrolase 1 n=2 Tax=Rickettsia typhi TaxID=785 RepID=GCH1_RICTY|nr:GTP cyclohydrolase I FolE [Rickettsia typhi]Q68WZ4.1 RecName: Full=GTP cyclohydrolase 1; AltName: Full=GTP cyclohydrolase I; Short=GTP-CH-I [Rickettsia typhi str. Wilmington]AAU03848.1 GTP cyclohydrolase I [Rickettsia typhi str. Wilmington]AFE54227.1 GTP cyclohydrolase I [Rickettsia typhi str. TH1527]AFE55067.1 GTP cyclohydrolase I [Rickettsia typhi str. B9991CWPP]
MNKPTREEAKEAVRTLLRFIGEDPTREGLLKTPDRVINSYMEIFSGYGKDVQEILNTKFYDTYNFQDLISLEGIKFTSFCEHHILPFNGTVHIAYIPDNCIIGVSKLARIVNIFSRRLQIQEKMTVQIAESIQESLKPLGVAIKISAFHSCMSMRGVMHDNSVMNTMYYTGIFAEQQKYRHEFLNFIAKR